MTTTPSTDLTADIRIPDEIVNNVLNSAVTKLENPHIAKRLVDDKHFRLYAAKMTGDILLSASLAQTLSPDVSLAEIMPAAPFSGNDNDLRTLGQTMTLYICSMPRIPDAHIPDSLLKTRYDAVLAAI